MYAIYIPLQRVRIEQTNKKNFTHLILNFSKDKLSANRKQKKIMPSHQRIYKNGNHST